MTGRNGLSRKKDDRALFDDPESPQSRSFHWLSDDSFRQSDQATDRELLERYVLAVCYFSTDGDTWANPTKESYELFEFSQLSRTLAPGTTSIH